MHVCDQCKKEVVEGALIHLRFENKWFPQFHRLEAEFCSISCLLNLMKMKIPEEAKT
jgi:hypothetical protein